MDLFFKRSKGKGTISQDVKISPFPEISSVSSSAMGAKVSSQIQHNALISSRRSSPSGKSFRARICLSLTPISEAAFRSDYMAQAKTPPAPLLSEMQTFSREYVPLDISNVFEAASENVDLDASLPRVSAAQNESIVYTACHDIDKPFQV